MEITPAPEAVVTRAPDVRVSCCDCTFTFEAVSPRALAWMQENLSSEFRGTKALVSTPRAYQVILWMALDGLEAR